jgi:hypothetical protein
MRVSVRLSNNRLKLELVCLAVGHEWGTRLPEMNAEVEAMLQEISQDGTLTDEEKQIRAAAAFPKTRSKFRLEMWKKAQNLKLNLDFLE